MPGDLGRSFLGLLVVFAVGFAVQTYASGEYRFVRGKLQRNRERITVCGLNHNHNHDLKNLLKGAAVTAIERPGPLQDFYAALVKKGMRPSMARLTLAGDSGEGKR